MLFYKLYKDKNGRKTGFLQGNEACVEGAILAGVTFFAGYPITPSSEIAAVAAEKLPMYGGRFIQMEDEISAMAAVIGGSVTGRKAMTATSGPGFSLKQENLGYAILTELPCLIVNVQRGGPSTGLPTQVAQGDVMQARWGTHGDHPIIALSPSSVQETVELTIRGINLAEKYRTPVILLMDETLGHMREKVVLPMENEFERIQRKSTDQKCDDYKPYCYEEDNIPCFSPFGGENRYNITGLIHDEYGFPTAQTDEIKRLHDRLHAKIYNNLNDIVQVREYGTEDADIVLITYGSTTRSCLGAMDDARAKGLKVGVLQLQTIWPFPDKQIAGLLQKCSHTFVVELNMGQIINEVNRINSSSCKVIGINKYNGLYIYPDEILSEIERGIK